MQHDRLLTLKQCADLLQIPLVTLYQWRHKGQGPPSVRLNGTIRVRESDLEAWISSHATQSDGRAASL